MCKRKRNFWKTGIAMTGILLLQVLMVWVPLAAASVHESTAGVVTPGMVTVQATSTVDATVTALNKEKLAQEVQQLKKQNAPDLFGWLRTNAATLISTLLVVIGGLIGLFRWFGDRRSEREKRAEERFQSVVTGLGDDKEGARIGAAILLRTFLRRGYKQFYTQAFDLAVANLRFPETPQLSKGSDIPLELTSFRQALVVVFREVYPLILAMKEQKNLQVLDATGVKLDNAYIHGTYLRGVWMPQASLRKTDFVGGTLTGANLREADLREADLRRVDLSNADLSGADLRWANLSKDSKLSNELNIRSDPNMRNETILSNADLRWADLREADLSGTNIEDALYLEDTDLRGVIGLTKEQKAACKARGAIFNDARPPSTPSTQGGLPTPDADGSNAPSLKPGSESE